MWMNFWGEGKMSSVLMAVGQPGAGGADAGAGLTFVRDNVVVVAMRGLAPAPGDLTARRELRDRLHASVDAGVRHFVFDLRGVPHLDSAALGLFVDLLRRVRGEGSGTVSLAGVGAFVRRALDLTRLTLIFPVTDTVQEALDGIPLAAA